MDHSVKCFVNDIRMLKCWSRCILECLKKLDDANTTSSILLPFSFSLFVIIHDCRSLMQFFYLNNYTLSLFHICIDPRTTMEISVYVFCAIFIFQCQYIYMVCMLHFNMNESNQIKRHTELCIIREHVDLYSMCLCYSGQ